MENSVKVTAKSEEVALRLAAKELDIDIEKLEIKNAIEGKKSLFKKNDDCFVVGVKGKNEKEEEGVLEEIPLSEIGEETAEKIEQAKNWLENLVKELKITIKGINVRATCEHIYLSIEEDEPLKSLIGYRGETLNAIQILINSTVNKRGEKKTRFIIDCGSYRHNRDASLKSMVVRNIEKVIKNEECITLAPMNPYERRIVHTVVGENGEVDSKSFGREPKRRVIIFEKGKENEADNFITEKENFSNRKKWENKKGETIKKISTTYDFEKEFLKSKNGSKLYGKIEDGE